jgi:NADH-quinone oxidoreductase subunit G
MSDDLITIEIDGEPVKARKGALLIEVTDAADIYIPRFCYHKKLSIAANCRMCLVDVEKAPKPLPACATPVMEGMKVHTRSAAARDAQKSTMEFLLINHPLDCPICDQGGECELQDLALGYGSDVSRYSENKRVVKDKNIGPLVQTDMTRCIHCTRCVRFGTEVAGIRELGATGRSEHMQIGTYIEKAVTSELSGNVIDLCPVGALTSKPYRYSARAWELRQFDGIAPHDGVGSNIHLHAKGSIVKRVVPRDNEAINEVWISDRDRYSYEGLYSSERLLTPQVKRDGQWREVDWDTALRYTVAGIRNVLTQHGAAQLGALASPIATLEELYLFQKVARGLGLKNIDHRLRQSDFSDQDRMPLYPGLGGAIADLESARAVLVIGSQLRKEQPLINHRVRKAAMRGADVMFVNPLHGDFNFQVTQELVQPADKLIRGLIGIAQALSKAGASTKGTKLPAMEPDPEQTAIASKLKSAAASAVILLGNLAQTHPRWATVHALARTIAELSGARIGYLPEAGNSAGAWLAGVLPHREAAGRKCSAPGLDAQAMWAAKLRGYLLLGLEPELDGLSGSGALAALQQADFVVSLSGYRTEAMADYADVLLPIAQFAETSGTYVNLTGTWQSQAAAVSQRGESRPGWKVLRVLGNLFEIPDFEYVTSEDVRSELKTLVGSAKVDPMAAEAPSALSGDAREAGLELLIEIPMHRLDPVLRRAKALQQTPDAGDQAVHVNAATAQAFGLMSADAIAELRQGSVTVEAPVVVDARLPDGVVLVHGAQPFSISLRSGEVVALRRTR